MGTSRFLREGADRMKRVQSELSVDKSLGRQLAKLAAVVNRKLAQVPETPLVGHVGDLHIGPGLLQGGPSTLQPDRLKVLLW